MELEIRLHGRGGQGGVTCAKILAAIYAELGQSVQTFGDYAGERSGAPVRAYTRISDTPVTNRNKVYNPGHLLVLDPTLLGDDTVAGLAAGGLLLINTPEPPDTFRKRFGRFQVAAIDATAIAREFGIGTRSVVIVNTTIVGAYARVAGIPLETLDRAYERLHLRRDLEAAHRAYEAVRLGSVPVTASLNGPVTAKTPLPVIPLTAHHQGYPTGLKTGAWRTQAPAYVEHLAPCNVWCPAGNDVVGFIQALKSGGESAAAEVLSRSQPLASVCGRVCPAPCMEGCSRGQYDGAVNIRSLERWIGDRAVVTRPSEKRVRRLRRVAVVGSGPAGLAACYEIARAGHEATLIEGEKELGGVLRTGIPAYRLPRAVLDRDIQMILDLGVDVRTGVFLDRSGIRKLSRDFDAVILAAGLRQLAVPPIRNMECGGVEQGIEFLHRVNLGLRAFARGHVVVLGGGNTAMDCARSALRSGAERVTVVYRRTRGEMPAIREEIEAAALEGVSFLFLRQPVAFTGGDRLTGIEIAEVDLGDPDETGRRRPIVSDRTSRLACDQVLLALGQSADRGLLPPDAVILEGRLHEPGGGSNIFVAGDYGTGEGTVAHAIGDGRRAAGRALKALGEKTTVFIRPDRAEAVPISGIHFDRFPLRAAVPDRHLPVEERAGTFDEVCLGISAADEVDRCFSCGRCTHCDTCLVYCPEGIIDRVASGYEIDLNFCKGCGVCVTECPRSAMEMKPV